MDIIDSFIRLVNIDWLADSNWFDCLTCWLKSIRRKTTCEDLVNKGSNFANFVRFRPHTYTRTQQSLPPPIGGNHKKRHQLNLSKAKSTYSRISLVLFRICLLSDGLSERLRLIEWIRNHLEEAGNTAFLFSVKIKKVLGKLSTVLAVFKSL